VTGLFWFLLAPTRTAKENLHYVTFHIHATNSILFLVEIFMIAIPIRLLHFIYPIVVTGAYVALALILHFTSVNSSIYPILDFSENFGLSITIFLLSAFIATPILHSIAFLVFLLRKFIANRIKRVRRL